MALLGLFSVLILAITLYCFHEFRALNRSLNAFSKEENARWKRMQALAGASSPEEAFDDVTHPLRRGVSWLANLANLSTLAGLLGTVLGIYRAFQQLEAAGESTITVFSRGIYEAITTTIVGLSLAIPALIFHFLFRDRYARLEVDTIRRLCRSKESEDGT